MRPTWSNQCPNIWCHPTIQIHLKMRARSSLETSGSDYSLTQRHIPECNLQTKSAVNFHIRWRSIRSEARYRNFQSRCSQKTNTLRCAWMGASSKGPHSTHSTVTMRCIYRQKIFPLCWAYTKWEYLLDHQSESFWEIFTRIRSTERMAALLYTCKVELYYTRRVRKIKIHHV